jgi:hypothetical protein
MSSASIKNISGSNLTIDGNLPLRVDLQPNETISIRDSVYELNRELLEDLTAKSLIQIILKDNMQQRVLQQVSTGVNNSVIALDPPADDIVSVVAIVTTTGAFPTTGALLKSGVDYVISGVGNLGILTNQTANTLMIAYHEYSQNKITNSDFHNRFNMTA